LQNDELKKTMRATRPKTLIFVIYYILSGYFRDVNYCEQGENFAIALYGNKFRMIFTFRQKTQQKELSLYSHPVKDLQSPKLKATSNFHSFPFNC
jgi:hypothetical protein